MFPSIVTRQFARRAASQSFNNNTTNRITRKPSFGLTSSYRQPKSALTETSPSNNIKPERTSTSAKMYGAPARSSSCFKCGQQAGHLSRDCPQPKNKACYTCGQEGHISSACPSGPAAGGFGGAAGAGAAGGECYRCGKPGHIARMCPESGAQGFQGQGGYGGGYANFGGKSCYTCGGVGHISRECPSGGNNRQFGGRQGGFGGVKKCYNCGQEGHISRECPQEQGRTCYSCGQAGHIASACPGANGDAAAAPAPAADEPAQA
ncbi:cellular nucleic acid-binding protein [Kwoniella heveanensis BCC8398]|uniref:Cellular nucleic acid-binding protein n=1 Tax=Kwoniella heveanensis BCC8398 TaxID=1296120 RepID=A0A1B9GTA7_9TREE|nr:cellular nucleic acid-binding protein [Kwoniella heveanensis BCC8398]